MTIRGAVVSPRSLCQCQLYYEQWLFCCPGPSGPLFSFRDFPSWEEDFVILSWDLVVSSILSRGEAGGDIECMHIGPQYLGATW